MALTAGHPFFGGQYDSSTERKYERVSAYKPPLPVAATLDVYRTRGRPSLWQLLTHGVQYKNDDNQPL